MDGATTTSRQAGDGESPLIVREENKYIKRPLHINARARAVAGLLHIGRTDPIDIARLLDTDVEIVQCIILALLASTSKTVKRALSIGLPPWGSAPLAEGRTIICPSCCKRINRVSCVRCSRNWGRPDGDREWKEKRMRRPTEKTTFLPGSPEKIAVMCERVRRNELPFHPDDALTIPLYIPAVEEFD